MKKKIVFLPYDFDTAIGINNEGALVFSYNLEDIDTTDGGADVFNGQQSVFWQNMRAAYFDEMKTMYQSLRSTGALSYSDTENRFEEHQAKWPEAIFNEDAWFKYLAPLVESGSAAYLSMLQGSKAEQRKWWLYNRFRYIDSKYNAGDALTDVITVRGYAKANVTVTPYADVYASVKYGSYLVQERAARNTEHTLVCPLDNVNDTEIYIYSASQLASVGDLSGLMVGYGEFSMATKLQSLKLGDASSDYSNGNLTELYLGNNVLLKTLDVRNCPNLKQAIDVSGCANIEEIYFDGTAITGLLLPNGGILKTLSLPETITNLTIRNQTAITDFSVPSYVNISTLRLENVSSVVDSKAILQAIPENSRVRIIGFDWEVEDADEASALMDILDKMRGLDENGNNMDSAQVSGTIHMSAITGSELAELNSRYSNITITYDHIQSYCYFYNYDGSELIYTETCLDGADASYSSKPSRASTAQYTYTFAGWATTPNGSADSNALKAITADRNVYAAYTATVRTYTVYFYNGSTLLQTTQNVAYGSSASYTGDTPEKTGVTDPENYTFKGWSPQPSNIQGNTSCYADYTYTGIEETIEDSWEEIIANVDNGTYASKYSVGDTKLIDLGEEGTVAMQIVAFDMDNLADGSGKAPVTWISEQLLKSSAKMSGVMLSVDLDACTYTTKKAVIRADLYSTYVNMAYYGAAKIGGSVTGTWTATVTNDSVVTITPRASSIAMTLVNGTQISEATEVSNGDVISITLTTSVNAYTKTSHSTTEQRISVLGTTEKLTVSDQSIESDYIEYMSIKVYLEGTGTVGGWEKSKMRTYVSSLKTSLPTEVQNAIKSVTKGQWSYNTSGSSVKQYTTDDLWIPSYYEIIKNTENPNYTEFFADEDNLIKKKAGASAALSWWLRESYSVEKYRIMNPYGKVSSGDAIASAYGVALGFCL